LRGSSLRKQPLKFCRRLPAALAVRAVFLGAGSGWVSLSGLYAGEVAGAERQNLVN